MKLVYFSSRKETEYTNSRASSKKNIKSRKTQNAKNTTDRKKKKNNKHHGQKKNDIMTNSQHNLIQKNNDWLI